MQCGCTIEHPACARGEALFTALVQAQYHFTTASGENREEQWEMFSQARIAYLDHVHGWRQGDLRVRNQGGTWLVEQHQQAQWPLQFGTTDGTELQAWLKQRFWRYAQLDEMGFRDHLTGYYHQRPLPAHLSDCSREETRPMARLLVGQQRRHPWSAISLSKEAVRPEVDRKTQIALVIAVQIGHTSQPLTPLDHLSLQRKAIDLLLSSGEQRIEAEDITWIQAVIEEAEHLRETLTDAQNAADPQSEQAPSPDAPAINHE